MSQRRQLPPALAERVRRFAAGGTDPVVPRPAATVLLLRDDPAAGLRVYLLRRMRSMAFAGGMYAFPGGAVEADDVDFLGAAVRETFEEAGVLLAGPSSDAIIEDVTGADWEADRQALVRKELLFADFLDRRGLVIRRDLLVRWAHWITPEFEERRYDTHFFVAALPAGQRTRDVSGEADRVCWLTPAEALAQLHRSEINMLPPTAVTLADLTAYPSVGSVLAAASARDVPTITPVAVIEGDEVRLILPGEDGYPT